MSSDCVGYRADAGGVLSKNENGGEIMGYEGRIISVEHLRNDGILINLTDGTSIHLTLDQLLHLGVPQFRIADDDHSFEQAMRKAFKGTVPEK